MDTAEVAVPMGVLVTAAVFLAGAFSARAESVLARLPADLARVLDWSRPRPGREDNLKGLGSRDDRIPSLGAGTAAIVAVVLLGANSTLAVAGLRSAPDDSTVVVVLAHLAAHVVVLWWTVAEVTSARRRYRAAQVVSAPALLLAELSFTTPPAGTKGRRLLTREHLARVGLAVAAVPPGVPDGTYRDYLAKAHVEYAKVLLDEGLPREALHELEAAGQQPWSPGWLAQRGAHGTEQSFETMSTVDLWALKARAHHDLRDSSAEVDDLLEAARQGGVKIDDRIALLEAARRSGRIVELSELVRGRPGEPEPAWIEMLRLDLGRALDSDHNLLGRLENPGLELTELRLLDAVEHSARNLLWLATGLLDAAVDSSAELREGHLDEVAELLEVDLSTSAWRHEWRRARARLHELDGETDAVVDLLVEEVVDGRLGSARFAAEMAVRLGVDGAVATELRRLAKASAPEADPMARSVRRRAQSHHDAFKDEVTRIRSGPVEGGLDA